MSIAIAREERRKERKDGVIMRIQVQIRGLKMSSRFKGELGFSRFSFTFYLSQQSLGQSSQYINWGKHGSDPHPSLLLVCSLLSLFIAFFIIICRLSSNQVRIEILHGGSSDEEQRQSCTTLMMFTSICADKFLTTHIFSELLSLFPLFLLHLFWQISFIFSVCVYQFIFQAIFWVFLYSIDF